MAPLQAVIGVVNDAKQVSPRDRAMGVVYLPLRRLTHVVLAIRTADAPAAAVPMVQASARCDRRRSSHRECPDDCGGAGRRHRAGAPDEWISLILAALVIAIGCVGLYALMSYDVAQRTRELGIRLALGATSTSVMAMVLRDSAALVVPGLAIGVPLGIAASRPLSSQLYGVETNDPWTLASVALLLSVVALLATLRPAQTAARIDPIALLRND